MTAFENESSIEKNIRQNPVADLPQTSEAGQLGSVPCWVRIIH